MMQINYKYKHLMAVVTKAELKGNFDYAYIFMLLIIGKNILPTYTITTIQ